MGVISKIKGNSEIRRVAENSISLTVLTFINYGFPLFLIPYLTRVLGAETYGLYAFVLAVISYFTLIVRFGFEFSATKQLAIIREDKAAVNKLFSVVMSIRVLLMFLSALILSLLVAFIPKIHDDKLLFYLGIGIFIGNGLVPVWFFQGIENMKLMTLANFVTRLISTLLIVVFVKSSDGCAMAVGFQSVGFIMGGVFSLFLVFYKFNIVLLRPTWFEIKQQVKSSWHLFLSNVGVNFYRESNVIILGFLTDYQFVGFYAAAEKIIKAIQSLLNPVVQALFPFFGRRLNVGKKQSESLRNYFKLGKIYGIILLSVAILIVVLSPWGIRFILGFEYVDSILNIQVLSGVIIFGGLNYYFGIVGLVNLGFEKQFSRCVWLTGMLSLCLSFILINLFDDLGAAIAMSLVEALLFMFIISVFLKRVFVKSGKRNVIID